MDMSYDVGKNFEVLNAKLDGIIDKLLLEFPEPEKVAEKSQSLRTRK